MNTQDIAMQRAIQHLQESARAIREAVRAKRKLNEAYGLEKPDGSRITVYDLYQAVNQASAGYGGAVGDNLREAAQIMFQAYQADMAAQQPQAAPAAPAAPARESRQPSTKKKT